MTHSRASRKSARSDPAARPERTAVVTGGGSGIGLAIARRLARGGFTVAITSRSLKRLRAAARSAYSQDGVRLHPYAMDVRRAAPVAKAFREIRRHLGPFDVVVANAGRSGVTPIRDRDERPFRDIVETNLTGTYRTVKDALPHLAPKGARRIVVVSSVLGKIGVAGYSAYCASKHGHVGLVRALALELAPERITVNAVCPGWVETEMAAEGIRRMARDLGVSKAEAQRQALKEVPLGRFSSPEEVADLVAYLVSDAASMMTGQAVNLNGGSAMD